MNLGMGELINFLSKDRGCVSEERTDFAINKGDRNDKSIQWRSCYYKI